MARRDSLTPRQQEVLALLRVGLSNEEIAERLGISVQGVKFHVSEILGKLGLENRADAARWEPEERRPPWVVAPLLAVWRKAGTGLVAAMAVTTLVIAGVSVLTWSLIAHSGSNGAGASRAVTLPPGSTGVLDVRAGALSAVPTPGRLYVQWLGEDALSAADFNVGRWVALALDGSLLHTGPAYDGTFVSEPFLGTTAMFGLDAGAGSSAENSPSFVGHLDLGDSTGRTTGGTFTVQPSPDGRWVARSLFLTTHRLMPIEITSSLTHQSYYFEMEGRCGAFFDWSEDSSRLLVSATGC